ncbi:MAG TPA: hypothetical protein VIE65_13555, partial [Methylobacter sp.]
LLRGAPESSSEVRSDFGGKWRTPLIATTTPLAIFNPPPFSHGLQEKRTTRNSRENQAVARILTLKKNSAPTCGAPSQLVPQNVFRIPYGSHPRALGKQ